MDSKKDSIKNHKDYSEKFMSQTDGVFEGTYDIPRLKMKPL